MGARSVHRPRLVGRLAAPRGDMAPGALGDSVRWPDLRATRAGNAGGPPRAASAGNPLEHLPSGHGGPGPVARPRGGVPRGWRPLRGAVWRRPAARPIAQGLRDSGQLDQDARAPALVEHLLLLGRVGVRHGAAGQHDHLHAELAAGCADRQPPHRLDHRLVGDQLRDLAGRPGRDGLVFRLPASQRTGGSGGRAVRPIRCSR